MKFWESWLLSKKFSISSDFCLNLKGAKLFLNKFILGWSCSFTRQVEQPLSSPPSASLELSYFKVHLKKAGTSKHSIPQAQSKISAFSKVSIPSTSVSMFSTIMVLDVAGWCFKPLPDHRCKGLVTLLLKGLPQQESRSSILVYILRKLFWCYIYIR